MDSSAQHVGADPDFDVESTLDRLLREILAREALTPDEILSRVRVSIPGLTMDRMLVMLYEDATVFRRSRGRWCAGPADEMSYPQRTLVP